jgi:hypothetical protein
MSEETTVSNVKTNWIAPIENRKERADYFFQNVLENQREWYSTKAGTQKKRHLFFAISVIVLGALISCLQVLDAAAWVRYLTATLGALVSVFRAIDTLLRPGEAWQGYRKASENMKREYRLYINNADIYADASGEDAAFQLLVVRLETVLAEEQQLFWQSHTKNPAPQQTPNSEGEAE